MGSWRYAYFFNDAEQALEPAGILKTFEDAGFSFGEKLLSARVVDKEGHVEFTGEQKPFPAASFDASNQLGEGAQFQVECFNEDLFFALCFTTKYVNPFIVIGWSNRLFHRIAADRQAGYMRMLRQAALACNAAYVILVDDPPDYFEDRFLDIDGKRFLDPLMPSGERYEIREVWARENLKHLPPEGVSGPGTAIGQGFVRFCSID